MVVTGREAMHVQPQAEEEKIGGGGGCHRKWEGHFRHKKKIIMIVYTRTTKIFARVLGAGGDLFCLIFFTLHFYYTLF